MPFTNDSLESEKLQRIATYRGYEATTKLTGTVQTLHKHFPMTPSSVKCLAYVGQLQIGMSYLYMNDTENETFIITFQLQCRNIEVLWLSEQGEELVSMMPIASQTDIRVEVTPNQASRILVLRPISGSRYTLKMSDQIFKMTTNLPLQNLENMARMIGDVSSIN